MNQHPMIVRNLGSNSCASTSSAPCDRGATRLLPYNDGCRHDLARRAVIDPRRLCMLSLTGSVVALSVADYHRVSLRPLSFGATSVRDGLPSARLTCFPVVGPVLAGKFQLAAQRFAAVGRGRTMKRSRFSECADTLHSAASGGRHGDRRGLRKAGVSEATFYNWRKNTTA